MGSVFTFLTLFDGREEKAIMVVVVVALAGRDREREMKTKGKQKIQSLVYHSWLVFYVLKGKKNNNSSLSLSGVMIECNK